MSELAKQRKEESEWSAEIKFLSGDNIMNGPKNVVLCTKIHLISVLREVIYKSRSLKNLGDRMRPMATDFEASCSVMSCGTSDTEAIRPLNIWPVV